MRLKEMRGPMPSAPSLGSSPPPRRWCGLPILRKVLTVSGVGERCLRARLQPGRANHRNPSEALEVAPLSRCRPLALEENGALRRPQGTVSHPRCSSMRRRGGFLRRSPHRTSMPEAHRFLKATARPSRTGGGQLAREAFVLANRPRASPGHRQGGTGCLDRRRGVFRDVWPRALLLRPVTSGQDWEAATLRTPRTLEITTPIAASLTGLRPRDAPQEAVCGTLPRCERRLEARLHRCAFK